ncbi:MAG TPA: hypothetical protein VJK04_02000 [Candidatus Paceibacterota bacterium]
MRNKITAYNGEPKIGLSSFCEVLDFGNTVGSEHIKHYALRLVTTEFYLDYFK